MSSHRITPNENTSAALEYACTFHFDTYPKWIWIMFPFMASQRPCSVLYQMFQSEASAWVTR